MDDEDEEHKGDEPEDDDDDEPSSNTSTMLSAREPDNCADKNASTDGKEEDGKKSTDKNGASSEDPCKSFASTPVEKSKPQKSSEEKEVKAAKEVKVSSKALECLINEQDFSSRIRVSRPGPTCPKRRLRNRRRPPLDHLHRMPTDPRRPKPRWSRQSQRPPQLRLANLK